MNAPDRRAEPWRDGDVLTVCATTFIGLAVIVAAWFGVSGTVSATRQAAWLNAGVAGFATAAGGLCLWLLRLRRAVGERRVALISLAPQEDPYVSALPEGSYMPASPDDAYVPAPQSDRHESAPQRQPYAPAPQRHAYEPTRTAGPPQRARPEDPTAPLQWVRAAGMARLHHPGCPLVAGKAVTPAGLDDGEPCGVCAA
ncbi:hypothetical protein H1V43_20920 [Streptomyces sp. PSKA54]|uniref:Uncharacterized protein n=1 Tax=Streptomyces himalayensis subsp. aureolus TaxID=2758039 RepID=A0A7W2HH96_9ACTN|nr:hypothetical protein [Streptomyces himalayensis]MBA4863790.1 hypothetical protein [Streptomyces himalayensis subsp. aureolus]